MFGHPAHAVSCSLSASARPPACLPAPSLPTNRPAGYDKCKAQRQALESYLRSKEAFGQQATSLEHHLAQQAAAQAEFERQEGKRQE